MAVWPRLALVVLLGFSLFGEDLSLSHKLIPCTSGYDSCKCSFPDGQSLDLTPLRKEEFGWIPASNLANHSLFFKACGSDFTNSSVECFQASVCLSVNDSTYHNLGTAKEGSLVMESIARQPYLHFDKGGRVTTIQLKCDPDADKATLTFLAAKENNYELTLRSKECCLKAVLGGGGGGGGGGGRGGSSLGVGSVLLLVALVLLLAYFLLGVLVLYFIKGARGLEAIPNHTFWQGLCTSSRDGFLFLVNGCRTPASYDRI